MARTGETTRDGIAAGRRLDDVDLSHVDAGRGALDSLHPYPAKFIPALPGSLLDCIEIPPGSAVLDPFAGSGTTLVEAQKRSLPSVGVDVNPIACLISRVKVAAQPANAKSAAVEVVEESRARSAGQVVGIPNVDHWFAPEIRDTV